MFKLFPNGEEGRLCGVDQNYVYLNTTKLERLWRYKE
jgi:hypothetical protein